MPKSTTGWSALWLARVEREHIAGNLTRAYRDVLRALPTFRGRGGIFPSHAELAKRALCSTRHTRRALDMARELGLIDWRSRGRQRVGRWRSERKSNIYTLQLPVGPVTPGKRAAAERQRSCGQNSRGISKNKKEARDAEHLQAERDMIEHARSLKRDLLAERRARFFAQQVQIARARYCGGAGDVANL